MISLWRLYGGPHAGCLRVQVTFVFNNAEEAAIGRVIGKSDEVEENLRLKVRGRFLGPVGDACANTAIEAVNLLIEEGFREKG